MILKHLKRCYNGVCDYFNLKKLKKVNSIDKSVRISRKASISRNCIIKKDTNIAGTVSLDNYVIIGSRNNLERITIGEKSHIDSSIIITGFGDGKISIGHDSYIGPVTALDFSNNIQIGNFVHIAGLSTGLWTHTSAKMCLNSIGIETKIDIYRPTAPIVIEDNVYIGGNCTIYPGVKISHHSIVAPNSAVTLDVPPYSMVGGVPAKFIKSTKDFIIK